jgi:hypothetical protein
VSEASSKTGKPLLDHILASHPELFLREKVPDRTTIGRVLEKKEQILAHCEGKSDSQLRHSVQALNRATFPKEEEAVFNWVKSKQSVGLPISGDMLQHAMATAFKE